MKLIQRIVTPIAARVGAFDRYNPDADGPISRQSEILVWWISATLWFAILSEKIALPPFNIEICFFAGIGLVAMLFYRGLLVIEQKRAVGFFIFCTILLGEQLFTPFRESFSVPGVLAAMCYYVIFMFVAPLEKAAVFRIMRNFVGITTLVAFLVYVDWIFNLTHHALPNMDKILPDDFLFLHYVYVQPVHWASPYTKPNAFFMLEASHTSQMLAMGIIAEFCTRQNLARLAFLFLALLSTYAGTGFLMLLAVGPFLLPRAKSSTLMIAAMVVPLIIGGAAAKGLLNDYLARSTEFNQQGASANQRFVWPYQLAWQQLNSGAHDAYLGIGASNSAYDARLPVFIKGRPNGAPAYGTPTKLLIEFGIFVAVVWSAYFWIILARGAVPLPIIAMIWIQYEALNGGLLVPVQILYCYLLCAIYVKPNPRWRVSSRLADYVAPAATPMAMATASRGAPYSRS
ncbi:MAG TPA: hypothetical protein VGI79_01800 [Caulobacteraceae bacterium]|jgi:hypothetical protein